MLKRFILWDYPRACWQYDVMVGIILGFIFLTPREWFRDQPRIPHLGQIVVLPAEDGANVLWIESELLAGVAEGDRAAAARQILEKRFRTPQAVLRVEAIYDSEQEIKGYMAFVKP